MAGSKVEVVRGMWEPFTGLDVATIDWDAPVVRDALAPHFSPEVELSWSATWLGQRHYKGVDGVIQAFREWVEPFSEYHVEALDFIELDDHVVVPNRQWGTGRESGVPVDIEVTHLSEFVDGLIVRLDEFDTKQEALEAIEASQATGDG
jgi:ketosteroid isomerase-like protein